MPPSELSSTARYCAYLVRLWQDSPHAVWRATTHCVQTGDKRHFADLEQLFTFLQAQTVGKPVVEEKAK